MRRMRVVAVFHGITQFFDRTPRDLLWDTVVTLMAQATGVTLELKELHIGTPYMLGSQDVEVRRFPVRHGVREGSNEGPALARIC